MNDLKHLNIYFKSTKNLLSVGTLSISGASSQRPVCYFAYDQFWLEHGFALGKDLPLIARVFQTSPRFPLFGFMQDLIPGIGARKLHKLMAKKDFTNIELFLHSQESIRPGALGFYSQTKASLQSRAIPSVIRDLERLMMGQVNISDIDNLYSALSSLPGERFKLSYVNGKNTNVIAKFTHPDPERNLAVWEAVALSLAKRIGLKTVSAELTSFRGINALVTERFDRDSQDNALGFATAQALLGAAPNSYHSYLEVADILNESGESPREDLEELWKRMVFNMAIGNVNDALNNIGFLRSQNGWRLSPIYSLTPTPLPVNRRHHATGVTQDCDSPDLTKAIEVCRYFALSNRKAVELAHEITSYCSQNWETVAQDLQADPIEMDTMSTSFARLNQ